MRFDGYDLIIVGTLLVTGGTLLFGKAYFAPSFLVEAAGTYLGANPFALRNAIVIKHEYVAGAVWTVVGVGLILVGTVRSVRASRQSYLVSAWYDIIILMALALVFWRATLLVTGRTSRAEYLPVMVEMHREMYEGVLKTLVSPVSSSSPEERARRVTEMKGRLEQMGKVLDEPRLVEEADDAYAERLGRYFLEAQRPGPVIPPDSRSGAGGGLATLE